MSSIDKYTSLIKNLLPKGKLWKPQVQPVFNQYLRALAEEFCRVEQRVLDMLFEADPRQTLELLEDWQRLLGLPDSCTFETLDLNELREQIVQKLTNVGGLSANFYEFIGEQLGHDITVEDYLNFRAGFSKAGDPLTNYFNEHFVAGSPAGEFLTNIGWKFYFKVEMPVTAAEVFEAGDVAGTPLREFTNPLIECTMMRLKPAHAAVFFTFKE